MSSPALPSTPRLSIGSAAVEESSPGNWRHPHLDEIVRRQNASTFGDRHLRKSMWNGGALVFSFLLSGMLHKGLGAIGLSDYTSYTVYLLRLYLLANIASALYPLYKAKDELTDIPLTPSQRQLLGLDPHATPPLTPGSTYITPPRYRVTSGSQPSSATGAGHRSPSFGSSPVSNSPFRGRQSESPFSSPLLQRTTVSARDMRDLGRRSSFGSSSSLLVNNTGTAVGTNRTLFKSPSASNALGGKRASLGYNSKWLYEKGMGA